MGRILHSWLEKVADEVSLVGEWGWGLWCGLAEGLLIHRPVSSVKLHAGRGDKLCEVSQQ